MSLKYLGEQFDIHTGGIDLIPTHHENEIAQSKRKNRKNTSKLLATWRIFTNKWRKMSKSLGNVYFTKRHKRKKDMTHLYINYFATHATTEKQTKFYMGRNRSNIKIIRKIKNAYQTHLQGNDELKDADIRKISDIEEKKFHKAINDDMNMPLAMSFVWEAARFEKKKS